MSAPHIVIVGAGPAGGTAAATLRKEGFDGRVTLVGAEPYRPYIRPPLSKQYLRGEVDRDSVFLEDASWYADHDIHQQYGSTATRIDTAGHEVTLSGGEPLRYDSLLLTTGSTPRRLPLEGANLDGVRYLRTLDDSTALHELLVAGDRRLVLIGSGWIGMEVAASARTLGNAVTILERDPIPLVAAVGDRLGQFFADLHTSNGIDLRPSVDVAAIVGEQGHVTGVRLASGDVVAADIVLIGIGAVPNLALAESAGIATDNGVLVDERLLSSAPDVYAAGDIANALHPVAGVRIRSEHLSNALKGGTAAARIMMGQDVVYGDLPTFVSEQFDVTLQFAGYAPLMRHASLVVRGDPASHRFSAFWLDGDRPVAGVHINEPDREKVMQGLIKNGRPVDADRLADPAVPLGEL